MNLKSVTGEALPQGQASSVPRLARTDPDVVLLVDVLQELHVQTLVAHFGIPKVAQILRKTVIHLF